LAYVASWQQRGGRGAGRPAAPAGLERFLPLRTWFVLLCVVNGLATYAGLTWLTSQFAMDGWHRLYVGALAVLAVPLVAALLFSFAPEAGRAFVASSHPTVPPLGSPNRHWFLLEGHVRRRAVWAFVTGWVYFSLVCSCPLSVSPVSIVLALLFVLVAIYAF